MSAYFDAATARDAAWAVYFLSGRRVKRLVGASLLRTWLKEKCELPDWLVEETYASVGDLAETIALLLAQAGQAAEDLPLSDWVEQRLLPLRGMDSEQQRQAILQWWHQLDYAQCYIVNKLMTGSLRVGVSQVLLARAVAAHAGLPRALVLHRLMGEWTPDERFWSDLVAEDSGETVVSRPYPFCLASPLDTDPATLGPVDEWMAEW